MRFDLATVWQALAARASTGLPTLASVCGVGFAILTVLYLLWPASEAAVPVDVVVVADPVFTPVSLTPPAPRLAARAPAPGSRPSPSVQDDAYRDDVSLTRAVQRHLKQAGCYTGPLNGVWSAGTGRAMADFTERVNARLPVDRVDPVLLVLLETHDTETCNEARATRPEHRAETASIEKAPLAVPEPRAASREEPAPRASDARVREYDAGEPLPAASLPVHAAAALVATTTVTKKATATPERRRTTKRKHRKQPSLSRSFRNIQRSMRRMFF